MTTLKCLLICVLCCAVAAPVLGQTGGGGGLKESFDGAPLQGWRLEPGWAVLQYAPGQQGLYGDRHAWASYTAGTWSDFTLTLKLLLVQGGIHVNCRTNGPQRYFVGLREHAIYLTKQTGPDEFQDLADSQSLPGISLNQWHTVAVAGKAGQITAMVDGQTVITYSDPQPLTQGGIAFETLDDSRAWVDDVAVSPGGSAGATLVGILPVGPLAANPAAPPGSGQVSATPIQLPEPKVGAIVLPGSGQIGSLPTPMPEPKGDPPAPPGAGQVSATPIQLPEPKVGAIVLPGSGQIGDIPGPLPEPKGDPPAPPGAGQVSATPIQLPRPKTGLITPLLGKAPTRQDMLQSLTADPTGLAQVRALPGLGNRPLNQLMSVSMGGRAVQQTGLTTGAAGAGSGGVQLAMTPDAIKAAWEAGVRFSPCVPEPTATVGGKVVNLGRLSMHPVLLHKSLKEMCDEDVVDMRTDGRASIAQVNLWGLDAPASYMVAVRVVDESLGNSTSLVQGDKPVLALGIMDASGYRRVPLVPMQDGSGYVAVCHLTPSPPDALGVAPACLLDLVSDEDAAEIAPFMLGPSLNYVFGGFTVTRM